MRITSTSNKPKDYVEKMYSCKDESKQTAGIQQQGMVPMSAVCK